MITFKISVNEIRMEMYGDVVGNTRINWDKKIRVQRIPSVGSAAKWKNTLFRSGPEGLGYEKPTAKITWPQKDPASIDGRIEKSCCTSCVLFLFCWPTGKTGLRFGQ